MNNLTSIFYFSKTFGLIESNWGGTIIETWSTPEGLKKCGVDPYVDEKNPQQTNSHLYNGMIHPLTSLTIKGVLWYQGNYYPYNAIYNFMLGDEYFYDDRGV